MPTAKEYRRYAELCADLAKAADDKIERAILMQIIGATEKRHWVDFKDF
jgi:hypothetical protein